MSDEWYYYSFDGGDFLAQYANTPDNPISLLYPESDNLTTSSIFEPFDPTWVESDFLKAAEVVHQFEWGESLGGWQLFDEALYYDCARIEKGPVVATFDFFKIRNSSRFVTYIDVQPGVNIIRTRHKEYTYEGTTWGIVEASYITGKKALSIAEEHGGEEIRGQLDSSCTVEIRYSRPTKIQNEPVWEIAYVDDESGLSALRIKVNARTGEVLERKSTE